MKNSDAAGAVAFEDVEESAEEHEETPVDVEETLGYGEATSMASEKLLGGEDLPFSDTPERKGQSVMVHGEEQIYQLHWSPENGLKRPRGFEHLDLETRPKHSRIYGELNDLITENPRGIDDQSLSETLRNKDQSVMAIASVIADSVEPRALDVVDLATEDEPAPKVLSSQPELGLENRRKSEDSVDASECEWEANA